MHGTTLAAIPNCTLRWFFSAPLLWTSKAAWACPLRCASGGTHEREATNAVDLQPQGMMMDGDHLPCFNGAILTNPKMKYEMTLNTPPFLGRVP
jgi:hypothetical protein